MAHYPDFATFSKLAAGVDYVPVYRRVLSDVLTPVSAFHKIDDGNSACLFESVIGGEKVGRYSFLAAEPFNEVDVFEKSPSPAAPNPLEKLRHMVREIRVAKLPDLP